MTITTKRILGFGIDLMITGFIGAIIKFTLVDTAIISNNIGGLITLIIFLIRDVYSSNGSIGKKIMKTKLIINGNTQIFKVLRNITTLLWPIEGLILLITKKRLGDMVFKTDVVDI